MTAVDPTSKPATIASGIASAKRRPWWKEPVPIIFGSIVLLASVGVVAQDWINPPKPKDPRMNQVLPGGGTFCDPVPQPRQPVDPVNSAPAQTPQ